MFTGLIEEIGTIKAIDNHSIVIQANWVMSDLKLGDSISVNGVCLTVAKIQNSSFLLHLSPETLKRTTFSYLTPGTKVNLERALPVNARLGGHFVLGHVDGIGTVKKITQLNEFYLWEFEFPTELGKYIVEKGSIAVDGISLTVVEPQFNSFSVAIIPSTYANTNLQFLSEGDKVNLEVDIIGKYIEKLLSPYKKKSEITKEFLQEHGFY